MSHLRRLLLYKYNDLKSDWQDKWQVLQTHTYTDARGMAVPLQLRLANHYSGMIAVVIPIAC